jgi:hypothetical protein
MWALHLVLSFVIFRVNELGSNLVLEQGGKHACFRLYK